MTSAQRLLYDAMVRVASLRDTLPDERAIARRALGRAIEALDDARELVEHE